MDTGYFYFIKDEFFLDFPDPYLMQNKGPSHDRPCFYAWKDTATGLYWMIPFSSKVQKFREIYQKKIRRYGRCDTLLFGDVLGREKVFLLQNMFPVTTAYIKEEYIDRNANIPVRVSGVLETQLLRRAKRVLALHRRGSRLIYPDVLAIERQLLLPFVSPTPTKNP